MGTLGSDTWSRRTSALLSRCRSREADCGNPYRFAGTSDCRRLGHFCTVQASVFIFRFIPWETGREGASIGRPDDALGCLSAARTGLGQVALLWRRACEARRGRLEPSQSSQSGCFFLLLSGFRLECRVPTKSCSGLIRFATRFRNDTACRRWRFAARALRWRRSPGTPHASSGSQRSLPRSGLSANSGPAIA